MISCSPIEADPEQAKDIKHGVSNQFNWPPLHLLFLGKGSAYFKICVPLTNAAMKGNITKALRLMEMNGESVIRAAITEGYETVLHVAVGARQISFVQMILKLMSPEDLMLQDLNGNTAFCSAAMIGDIQIAKILLEKNASLLTFRGGQNMTPLYLAALFGHGAMVKFLYPGTKQILTPEDRKATFFISISTGLYDLASTLLENDKELAVARHDQYGSALEILAQRPSAFVSRSRGLFERLINSVPGMKLVADQDTEMISTQALRLLKCLSKEILPRQDEVAAEIKRNLRNSLFDAARLGNFEFLAELIHSYPDLIHELDENERTIFHIAVLYGHTNILKLLNEIGFAKELLMTYVDKDQNNILHLAAKYQPPCPVSSLGRAALQMQRELLKYKEVEMIVKPYYKEMKNSKGKTPRELFTIEHSELLRSGELWMTKTASSCMIIASLIIVVMFVVAFNGSTNMRENLNQVSVVANTVSLSSSLISMLIFLSLLTSHYAEDDFLQSLPQKLMSGLATLYISIISMIIVSCIVFLGSYQGRLNWAVVLSIVLASAAGSLVFLPRRSLVKA